MKKRLFGMVLVFCVLISTLSGLTAVAEPFYTLTVTTDATEAVSEGDIVVVKVILNTTQALSGYQFVLRFDPEVFTIDTYREAYINEEWAAEFSRLKAWQVPKMYTFNASSTTGKVSNVAYVDSNYADIPAADAVQDVAVMGINLIVKDATKAMTSEISVLTDHTLEFATSVEGANDPAVENTTISDTVVPVEPKEIDVIVNGETVTLTATDYAETDVIVVGAFNSSEIMIDIKFLPITGDLTHTFDEVDHALIMWLDDIDVLQPRCEHEFIQF